MPQEIETYFPYDGTFIEACIHDYTSTWKFKCAWTHFEHRENMSQDDLPKTEKEVKEKAIEWYWKYKLKDMDLDISI